jgi:coenzyme F420-reducing hydrogenase beta subunit
MDLNMMKTVCEINKCNGCMACIDMCHKNVITINDSLDRYNAVIDKSLCVNCGMCEKVCPNNVPVPKSSPQNWYQGWAKDEIRKQSSSGGAASAIIKAFIENGGYVASCKFIDGEFGFVVTNNLELAKAFAGSKYVKSNPIGIYRKIDALLRSGEKVLFIGLPCQVAALKRYIYSADNLYTIDLICHGTPSPLLLKKCMKEYGYILEDLKDLKFRINSIFGLNENGHGITRFHMIDDYLIDFLYSVDYTENCYSCNYASMDRVADVTLGDSWGTNLKSEVKMGISLILCQCDKGVELVKMADLELHDVDINNALAHNEQLNRPSKPNPKREKFFKLIKLGKDFTCATVRIFPVLRIEEKAKSIIKYYLKGNR